jgi:undecaprenyl-diphosphatase
MTTVQSLIMAILQGVTELFPVSSLGHAVVLPSLMHWPIDQKASTFLPFLVVLHLGTAVALLLYFWRDWRGFALGVFGQGPKSKKERHLLLLISVATAPAVIIGFALEHIVREFFSSPILAAVCLIINGLILFGGERVKHSGNKTLEQINWKTALVIGACQALALIPGLSRSGLTMIGGVLAGLSNKDSARFSFLLATPIIAGAGILELPKLFHHPENPISSIVFLSGIVAGITAYLSTSFLMRYFKKHNIDAFTPFAYYCCIVGITALVLLR